MYIDRRQKIGSESSDGCTEPFDQGYVEVLDENCKMTYQAVTVMDQHVEIIQKSEEDELEVPTRELDLKNIPGEEHKFVLRYKGPNRNRDRQIEVSFPNWTRPVWTNLPAQMEVPLYKCNITDVKKHPFQCLALTLQHMKDSEDKGLRPK